MANKILSKWAQMKGYDLIEEEEVVLNHLQGVPITYSIPNLSSIAASVPVTPESISSEIIKDLKPSLKKIGKLSYDKKGTITITVESISKDKLFARLEEATDFLINELPRHGVSFQDVCPFCNEADCDDYAVVGNLVYRTHGTCKRQEAQNILDQVEDNLQNGNFLLAIVMAFIGGLVGCVPSFLSIYFLEHVYALLFALIPLAAYYGYKLGQGKMVRAVPFIVSIIALLDTAFLALVTEFVWSLQDLQWNFGQFLAYVMSDISFFGLLMKDWGISFFFCLLGIAIAWGAISRSNRHLVKQSENYSRTINKEPGVVDQSEDQEKIM